MTPDQANTAPWKNAWTNLLNDVRQTFTPSLPRLTRVEVELVVANPGPSDDEVTMYLQKEGEKCWRLYQERCRSQTVAALCSLFPTEVWKFRLVTFTAFG